MRKTEHGKVLFLGTGGGNDVFSATLAMGALWRNGWRWRECAFAGVLSPFHRHATTDSGGIIGATITTLDSSRHLLRRDDPREIGFIDARAAEMVTRESLFDASRVYGLSIAQGAIGLTRTIRQLSTRYDYVVLVDLGGDIFYAGPRDAHVLSPMFDSIVLRAFNDAGVPGILFEAGPGTDGELAPEALRESFAASGAEAYDLDTPTVGWWSGLYKRWIEPFRPGRTVPVTIEAFQSEAKELLVVYRARAHLGCERHYANFDQRIATDLCRRFYLIDPQRIRNPFTVACDSPKDWFLKTQTAQQRTNNEANLEYVSVGNELWQFLTPSPLFSEEERFAQLNSALEAQVGADVCDGNWVFPSGWENLRAEWQGEFHVTAGGPLIELRHV